MTHRSRSADATATGHTCGPDRTGQASGTAPPAGTPTTPSPLLTTAKASRLLGITTRDLASLATAGVLHPEGTSARRYPAAEVQALRDSLDGVPCSVRAGLLGTLRQVLPAGPGTGSQLSHDGHYPYLLIRAAGGTQVRVWAVHTSAGWRYLWNQYRSHPAHDPAGAASAITASLTPPAPGQPAAPSPASPAASPSPAARRAARPRARRRAQSKTSGRAAAAPSASPATAAAMRAAPDAR
jgi:hypothetical protein